MLRVVNLRNYRLKQGEVLIYVDRSSVLGNPFKMRNSSDDERNRVCDEYEAYFQKRVAESGAFREQVKLIYSLVAKGYEVALGCWCYPKRCHAMYIADFVESHYSKQLNKLQAIK